jgi:hypothetical protein
VLTLKGLLNNSPKKKKRGHQVLKTGEIANGEIFRGEGVRNLLDEKLVQQFAHAKRLME